MMGKLIGIAPGVGDIQIQFLGILKDTYHVQAIFALNLASNTGEQPYMGRNMIAMHALRLVSKGSFGSVT